MTLIRRNFSDVPRFATNWLDDFFSGDLLDRENLQHRFTIPEVNIAEEDDKYRIELAVPGMKKEDFKIDLEHNVLTISSEQQEHTEDKGTNKVKYTKQEFHYSIFKRSFTLPEIADSDKITAKYENGVLGLEILKKDEAILNNKKTISIE